VPSIVSHDMRSKARPAAELEAEWQKEVDAKKAAEDETHRLEEEKRRQEEEIAEQERLKKVRRIKLVSGIFVKKKLILFISLFINLHMLTYYVRF